MKDLYRSSIDAFISNEDFAIKKRSFFYSAKSLRKTGRKSGR